MAAAAQLTRLEASLSGRVELTGAAAFGTPGAYVAIASVAALTPPAAPARVVLTQVAAFAPEVGTTTLQRTRVDGQWVVPPGTHMTRIDGAWVAT